MLSTRTGKFYRGIIPAEDMKSYSSEDSENTCEKGKTEEKPAVKDTEANSEEDDTERNPEVDDIEENPAKRCRKPPAWMKYYEVFEVEKKGEWLNFRFS